MQAGARRRGIGLADAAYTDVDCIADRRALVRDADVVLRRSHRRWKSSTR